MQRWELRTTFELEVCEVQEFKIFTATKAALIIV